MSLSSLPIGNVGGERTEKCEYCDGYWKRKDTSVRKRIPESKLFRELMLCLASALLRIYTELERMAQGMVIWFLAPTVALCKQQNLVISASFPAVGTKILLGSDNVDRWSTQSVWDAVLFGVSIVISTYQVLSDALCHGFVTMEKLALLIFDEAHHCTGNHAANRIMRDFYHPHKSKTGKVNIPHILGLTASPVVRSKAMELETIERNLDSITVTPRVHRSEFLTFVNRPLLDLLRYEEQDQGSSGCPDSLELLLNDGQGLIMQQNFSSLKLNNEVNLSKHRALTKFARKAQHIQAELGSWAANHYIDVAVREFKDAMRANGEKLLGPNNRQKDDLLTYLCQLRDLDSQSSTPLRTAALTSPKFQKLRQVLLQEHTPKFCGLIFVEQRATVFALCQLLSTCPDTKALFSCGMVVGASKNEMKKTELGDLSALQKQDNVLDDFRQGITNLVITTNALEEGIDVSICNLVVCFDDPPNLKSFIQRRGRARKENSKLVVLVSNDGGEARVKRFRLLEDEMMRTYQNDMRMLNEVGAQDEIHGERSEKFRVESTGALLTFDFAVAHLEHFCATLPPQPYVILRPIFNYDEDTSTRQIRARVALPTCLDPSLHLTYAKKSWESERMACKDAAFQAYVRLYEAGIVDDHLLPLQPEEEYPIDWPSIIDVSEQYNPWFDVAKAWQTKQKLHYNRILIRRPVRGPFEVDLVLPLRIPSMGDFHLYLEHATTYRVSLQESQENMFVPYKSVSIIQAITSLMLRLVFSDSILHTEKNLIALFAPLMDTDHLHIWFADNLGIRFNATFDRSGRLISNRGLLPGRKATDSLLVLPGRESDARTEKDDNKEGYFLGQSELTSTPRTKRGDFSHRNVSQTRVLDAASSVTVRAHMTDSISLDYTQFVLLAPLILHRVEINLVAEQLWTRIFPTAPLQKYDLVTAAIWKASEEKSLRRRLKLLGDCVLKFIVARQLFVNHTKWHVGCLTKQKVMIVSTRRMARAAIESGLDQFIITKRLNVWKWKPPQVSQMEGPSPNGKRPMSVKVLASTIKALIGVAFLERGLSEASICTRFFLSEVKSWSSTALFDDTYLASRPRKLQLPAYFSDLQQVLGYSCKEKSLVFEAITHPSYIGSSPVCSYQRLAFLGDAVLDMILVESLCHADKTASPEDIQLRKAAATNAHFLAFLCMEFSSSTEIFDVRETYNGGFHKIKSHRPLYLWQFMRYSGTDITIARKKSLERHSAICQSIRTALAEGSKYPWRQLAWLSADDFFSEIVQSLFGALFIDSSGDLTACRSLAQRMELFSYVRQLSRDNLDLQYPKSRLAELASGKNILYDHAINSECQAEFWCSVFINGKDVARISTPSTSKEYREIVASETALEKAGTELS